MSDQDRPTSDADSRDAEGTGEETRFRDLAPDPVRGPFPAWPLALAAVLGLGLAGTSGGMVTAAGIFIYAAAGLILGILVPAQRRALAVRWAGIGMVVQAVVRAGGEWAAGGIAGVGLGSVVPPSAVSLSGFLAAVVLGAWWVGIWQREGDAEAPHGRDRRWQRGLVTTR